MSAVSGRDGLLDLLDEVVERAEHRRGELLKKQIEGLASKAPPSDEVQHASANVTTELAKPNCVDPGSGSKPAGSQDSRSDALRQ